VEVGKARNIAQWSLAILPSLFITSTCGAFSFGMLFLSGARCVMGSADQGGVVGVADELFLFWQTTAILNSQ